MDNDSPALATIKLQVAFDEEYVAHQVAIDEDARKFVEQSDALLIEIVGARPRGTAASEALYRKVLTFVTTSGYISSADTVAMRAASAALESVLPRGEIGSLAAMQPKQKTAQLKELAGIVVGILLFNMATRRGGAHLENAAETAQTLGEEILSAIEAEKEPISRVISDITLVLNHAFARGVAPPGGQENLQQELAFRQQYLRYIETLGNDAREIYQRVAGNIKQYESEVATLAEALAGSASVPADTVYPRFSSLTALWRTLHADAILLRARSAMLGLLISHRPPKTQLPADAISAAAAALGAQRSIAPAPRETQPSATEATVIPADVHEPPELVDRSAPNFMQIPLALNGFCPYTIVNRNKLLLPGNRNLGIVRYKAKHYAFTSAEAIDAFLADPQRMLNNVFAIVKKAPELIHLLGLQSKFSSVPRLDHYAPTLSEGTDEKVDAGCQTLLHVVEKNIDNQYEWSEWALRRRALQLADLRNKRTHSSQTEASHFRRENETQTYLPKYVIIISEVHSY